MANEIRIFQNNSKTVLATITGLDTLDGYTPTLTVRDAIEATGTTFTLTGTTDVLVVTFEITPTMTTGLDGTYNYDVTLTNGVKNYTAIQSTMIISESVLW